MLQFRLRLRWWPRIVALPQLSFLWQFRSAFLIQYREFHTLQLPKSTGCDEPRTPPRQWVASYLPAVVLCLVVIHHIFQTTLYGLPRWKGGGFGMFSTIDSQHTRFVRVYVLTAQGDALPVELPRSYSRKIDRIRFVPGQGATADFAQDLLNTEWVWTDKHPHSTHALADDTGSWSSIQIKPKPKSADLFDAQPINMQGIRVEIFTFSYARDLQQLSTHLIDSVELRK